MSWHIHVKGKDDRYDTRGELRGLILNIRCTSLFSEGERQRLAMACS